MAASEEGQVDAENAPAPAPCQPVLPASGPPASAEPDAAPANGKPRTPGKAVNAFRTISEVSTDLEVPQHVLRFWESKFTQLRPLKRGGGRRYYRPEDIALLRRIHTLLYREGYTIKGVQQVLRNARKGDPATGPAPEVADIAPVAEPTIPGLPQLTPRPANSFLADLLRELKQLRALLD